ncbi:MAG: DUF6445 family protein [Sphingopyxis sp.]
MSGIEITARRVGADREPVVIIDGFHPDPSVLLALAARRTFVQAVRHYPGVRAELPGDYMPTTRKVIASVLGDVFACRDRIDILDASFSVVTTPPTELSIMQRLPHVDSVRPDRYAMVHYLSDGDGTAFFRHRSTGFESIPEARSAEYFARLNDELRDLGPPPRSYLCDSGPLFERISLVEARMNRAVIYRSSLLHSGAIAPDAILSDDPARGRLTVTAFFDAA